MSLLLKGIYRFGPYTLNAEKAVLTRDDDVVLLPPKIFDLLVLLVARDGGVLTKEEMLRALWSGVNVEESNVSQSVFTLRRKLGQTPEGEEYVQTIPRRGYRLSVPVQDLTPLNGATNIAPLDSRLATSPEPLSPSPAFWNPGTQQKLEAPLARNRLHSRRLHRSADAPLSGTPKTTHQPHLHAIDARRHGQARFRPHPGRPHRRPPHRRLAYLLHRRRIRRNPARRDLCLRRRSRHDPSGLSYDAATRLLSRPLGVARRRLRQSRLSPPSMGRLPPGWRVPPHRRHRSIGRGVVSRWLSISLHQGRGTLQILLRWLPRRPHLHATRHRLETTLVPGHPRHSPHRARQANEGAIPLAGWD